MTQFVEIGLTNAALATVLAIIIWGITRLWQQPVFVHALWVIVLLKLVTPPMVSIPWRLADGSSEPAVGNEFDVGAGPRISGAAARPSPDVEAPVGDDLWIEQPEEAGSIGLSPTDDPADTPPGRPPSGGVRWIEVSLVVAAGMWIAGGVSFLLVSVVRLARFHRALAHTEPASDELRRLARQAAERLGVARPFDLRVTAGRLAPLVWPVGRPTIVLSQSLVDNLSRDELQTLLAHELAHLRRKDHWVRWLELVAVAIYWWHPVAWWARTMIRRTEEQVCDAWVVWAFPDAARRYASALFTALELVCESRPTPPIVASQLSAGSNLKERIEAIMSTTTTRRLSRRMLISLALAILVILPFSLRLVQAADDAVASEVPQVDAASKEGAVAAPELPDSIPTQQGRNVQIERQLKSPVSLHVVEMPLEEALANLSQTVGVDIYLDPRALEQEDVTSDEPVTIQLRNQVSLGSALNLILEPLHLTFAVEDEVIKVTSTPLRRATASTEPQKIAPGDVLHVAASGVNPDAPIDDEFLVESGGTIALGPLYGRVRVAGRTFEQAEILVRDHLVRRSFTDPKVQITLGGWQRHPYVSNRPHDATPEPWPSPAHEPRSDDVEALREHVQLLSDQFRRIDEMVRAGSRGGSPDARDMTGYELATAEAALAQAEGRLDDAADHLRDAEKYAEQGLKSAKASFDAGRISHDTMLRAAGNLAESKRRRTRLQRYESTSGDFETPTGDAAAVSAHPSGLTSTPLQTPSIRLAETHLDAAQARYERVQALMKKQALPESELQNAEREVATRAEQLRQAQRARDYARLLVELAQTEYEQAVEANKALPGSVSELELRKLRIKVELAKTKLQAIAE